MEHFDTEFLSAGGWHDGVRTRVTDSAVNKPLISMHEMMHEKIFRETPDGQIHAAFCNALQLDSISAAERPFVEESARTFFQVSRLPQEVFATYLSVKSFISSAEPALIGQLTQEYLRYFQLFADIVDPQFSSSYVQFLVGWNSAVAVFSSPLLERLGSIDIGDSIHLLEDENWEIRFKRLLVMLEKADYTKLKQRLEVKAQNTCKQLGIAYWDIFSESSWRNKLFQDGQVSDRAGDGPLVEQALSEELREWLQSILPFTFLSGERLAKAFASFDDIISSKLKLIYTGWPNEKIEDTNTDTDTVANVSFQSKSRIKNTLSVRLPTGHREYLLSGEVFEQISAFAVCSACPPQNLTKWYVMLWTGDCKDLTANPTVAAQFDRDDVMDFFKIWLERDKQGFVVPEVLAIVIAVQGAEDFSRILLETDFLFWKHEKMFNKLCWYWWDRFYDVYKIYCGKSQPVFAGRFDTSGVTPFYGVDVLERAWQYNGLVIKVIHVSEKVGCGLFIRAFPMLSATSIISFENSLIESGKLQVMSNEMLEKFLPLANEVISYAQTFWNEY